MKTLYYVYYEADTDRFLMSGDGGEYSIDEIDMQGDTVREMAHSLKFDAERNISDSRVLVGDCMEAIRAWNRR